MAWTVLQSARVLGSSTPTLTASATYGSNVASGTKLIAYISYFASLSNSPMSSVKDGAGNSMTKIFDSWDATNLVDYSIWAMDTPAGDVGTKPVITMTISTTARQPTMIITEVSGLAVGNTLAAMADGTPAGRRSPRPRLTASPRTAAPLPGSSGVVRRGRRRPADDESAHGIRRMQARRTPTASPTAPRVQ